MTSFPTPFPRRYVKSSRSGGSGGNCVQWAFDPGGVYLRDSKNPDGPELFASYGQWHQLLTDLHAGTDHPWVTVTHDGGACVQHDGAELHFTAAEWSAFLGAVADGETAAPHAHAAG